MGVSSCLLQITGRSLLQTGVLAMAYYTTKTVVNISSAGRSRSRSDSDPTPRVSSASASPKERRTSGTLTPSKRSPASSHLDLTTGQPCLECGDGCPGYMQHTWRKKCINCSCPRETHKLDRDPRTIVPYIESLLLENGISHEQKQLLKYVWHPSGISVEMVEQYMSSLPEDCVPLKGKPGEARRARQFSLQLPTHDASPEACHKLSDLEKKRLLKFVERRKSKNFGVGSIELLESTSSKVCAGCSKKIPGGSVYVVAEREEGKAWHPQCFRCATCMELLVDLLYFHSPEQGHVYCGRHHGELIVPRCFGCDELIFTQTYTEAKDKNWHSEHFACTDCDTSVYRKTFGMVQERVVCERCFNKYADKCQKCREPIGPSSRKVTTKGKSWHEVCFVCKRCGEDLRGQQYFSVSGDLHCHECVQPVAQCHDCKKAISPTVSYFSHNNQCWHAECFKCASCKAWLVDGQFNQLEASLLCNTCYVRKVSEKCSVCNEPISKGIQFSSKLFHPECFTCCGCEKPLVGQNGSVKEKKGEPFCHECFLKTTKKCFKCKDPIITRHTVYKGHPFHLECFTCSNCGVSVAKSEFFETSTFEVLCYRCTK